MSQIILERSLACLTKKRIDKKSGFFFVYIREKNTPGFKHPYVHQIMPWLCLKRKQYTYKHATDGYIYIQLTTHAKLLVAGIRVVGL